MYRAHEEFMEFDSCSLETQFCYEAKMDQVELRKWLSELINFNLRHWESFTKDIEIQVYLQTLYWKNLYM